MDFFYGERERVLFASAAKGYLVSSIKDKLAEAQFEVAIADTLENANSAMENKMSAFVFYVDDSRMVGCYLGISHLYFLS